MSSSARQQAEARVGTLLDGKWTLDTFLGYGGSAAVYAATHRNGKRAAVKVLHAHCAADPDLVARFVREGYLANKIGHPGVVSVLDDDRADDGTVYLVMELLEGSSFERHGRGLATPLSIAEGLQVADDLLDILVKAHAVGLVHRDIKPANIFMTSGGQLKILDFGIARLSEAFSEGVTQTGMLMGTPAYMPPEQARGRWQDVDARSDIWAVGVTIASLLTGKRPRTADTAAEELLAAMMQPMPSLVTILPDAPPQVIALIDRANAFERHDRWQSAGDMQIAVREARKALNATSPFSTFAPSVTMRFAPEIHPSPHDGSPRDPTPPPTGQQGQFFGSTLLTPPITQRDAAHLYPPDPEAVPSLTTNRAMMRSAPPTGSHRPPASKVPLFIGGAVLLAMIGLGGMAAALLHGGKSPSAAARLGESASESAKPGEAPRPSETARSTETATATTAVATSADADTATDAGAVAVATTTPATEPAKKDKRPRPPRPAGTPVDPSKFFENQH